MNPFPIPAFTDNYIWAIIDEKAGTFDCVDPGEAQPVIHFATEKQLRLHNILLTHHHQDHIGGVPQLINTYPHVRIYGPKDLRIPQITQTLVAHQMVNSGPYKFQILFNPGHTSSHISYYEQKKGWLFCGDTLFSAGCGRVFDGTIEQLHQSLLLFKSLPLATKIFCGHEYTQQNLKFASSVEPNNSVILNYLHQLENQTSTCSLPSTLELELSINPFFRTEINEVKSYVQKHGASSAESLEVFRILRIQKNNF